MGIRGKLIISTALLALLSTIGPVAFLLLHQRGTIVNEFEQRGTVTAQQLTQSLSELAATLNTINDPETVSEFSQRKDVLAAYALDRNGMIVTDGTKRHYDGTNPLNYFEPLRPHLEASNQFVTMRDGGLLHVAGPVVRNGEQYGYVHLVISLERVGSILASTFYELLTVFAAALVVCCVLAALVAHHVCRPMKSLIEGAEALKSGNHRVRIPVKTRDEFANLAEAINEMATGLRATTVSKRYLDEVLQSMVDALVVVDTEATIVTVNKATLDLLGYTETQLVGQPASRICIDEGYQLTGARLKHLLGDQSQHDYELMFRTSDDKQIPISFSGSTICDNNGEPVGYVCIGKDISDRKRGEAEREKLNKQLVDTSRRAGMAEVATGVLHNVGNVLNSVNMSASLVVDTVRRSKVTGLTRAVELIDSHREDLGDFISQDDKGRKIPDYLAQLSKQLADEQSNILCELDSLTKNINHIKDIISMQQSYSKVTGLIEQVTVVELVEEALRMNEMMLQRHKVTVTREFAEMPPIKTDKHKTLQILVNLITNAKDAMDKMPADERDLKVTLKRDDDAGQVRIEVKDMGEGITEENLTKIFKHGFTTKKTGNGFGLHSAALTATELNGSLRALSEGPGTGATFVLALPMETEVIK